MALFVRGMACRLCGKPMLDHRDVVAFAPFVANKRDHLHLFSDGVFHLTCVEQHPLGCVAIAQNKLTMQASHPGRRVCAACGEAILDPDDYFATGYLASDPSDPLFEFNFVHLHRSHLRQWGRVEELRAAIKHMRDAGQWDGPDIVAV